MKEAKPDHSWDPRQRCFSDFGAWPIMMLWTTAPTIMVKVTYMISPVVNAEISPHFIGWKQEILLQARSLQCLARAVKNPVCTCPLWLLAAARSSTMCYRSTEANSCEDLSVQACGVSRRK